MGIGRAGGQTGRVNRGGLVEKGERHGRARRGAAKHSEEKIFEVEPRL